VLEKNVNMVLEKNVTMCWRRMLTWCWRRMLQIKWTGRITNGVVFQRVKEERLLLKILKNIRHLLTGHIIRHNNQFAVNILEGAISGKKAVGRP
jgi:hypothetical protein